MEAELKIQMATAGVEITHHFVGNQYAKITNIPAGVQLIQHKHSFNHWGDLLIGTVEVLIDGYDATVYHAPARLLMRAGDRHSIVAVTDALWACVWDNPGGITDPDEFDHQVTA